VPASSTRDFYHKLRQAGVPAVYVEFPQTEHGFDLQLKAICAIVKKQLRCSRTLNGLEDLSQYSPAAQAARYDLDRFLALMST
jgi:acetyl esterase/lipase